MYNKRISYSCRAGAKRLTSRSRTLAVKPEPPLQERYLTQKPRLLPQRRVNASHPRRLPFAPSFSPVAADSI